MKEYDIYYFISSESNVQNIKSIYERDSRGSR